MTDLRIAGPMGALHVDDGGSRAPPVVFVHSLAGALTHWKHQLAHVRVSRRAVAYDMRGHGLSETAEDADYSLDAHADDLAAVVDALELDRFDLVGHSLGGGVAIAYAARDPDRVRRLLLVDPIGDNRQAQQDELAEFLAALTQNYRVVIESFWKRILDGATEETRKRVLDDLRLTPRRAVIESLRRLMDYDVTGALRVYPGPVLDVITRFNETPTSLQRLVRTLETRKVDGVSHWLQLDRAGEFDGVLDEFLGT